jgi:hypothetical protein
LFVPGVVHDGSWILFARKETVSGEFPSVGVAIISPVIHAIFAESMKRETFEIASQTALTDRGFRIAISR